MYVFMYFYEYIYTTIQNMYTNLIDIDIGGINPYCNTHSYVHTNIIYTTRSSELIFCFNSDSLCVADLVNQPTVHFSTGPVRSGHIRGFLLAVSWAFGSMQGVAGRDGNSGVSAAVPLGLLAE